MLPDRVSNPGPLTYESGALPIALRVPATLRQGLILFSNQGMLSKITWVVCAISSFSGKKTPDEMMPRKLGHPYHLSMVNIRSNVNEKFCIL